MDGVARRSRLLSTGPEALEDDVADFSGMTVVDGTELNFEAIIKHSQKVPVLLHLYADWCKKFAPDLISRAQKAKGRVLLVNINTEKEERLAGYLRVQGLPTVMGIFQGKQVGGFVGSASAQELDELFTKVLASAGADSAEETMLEQAREALKLENVSAATQLFSNLLAAPQSSEVAKVSAMAGLIQCALLEKNITAAQSLSDHLKKTYAALLETHAAAQQSLAAVELAVSTSSLTGGKSVAEIKQQIAADPNNTQLYHELALAHLASSQFEEGLAACLEAIKIDRGNQDVKQLLFKSLDTLGSEHPLAQTTRRRLSNILFT